MDVPANDATALPPTDGPHTDPPASLAAEFPNVVTLERDGRVFHILGTAHVSRASVDEVKRLVARVGPDAVCVELCASRLEAMTEEDRWRKLDIFKVFREGKSLFLLANLALGAHQRRIGEALGVRPGAELLAAVEAAKTIGAEVVLADRDVHITLKRTWGNLGFWQKSKLLTAVIASLFEGGGASDASSEAVDAESIEALKNPANLSAVMASFAKAFPAVKGPLIDERDQHLLSMVRESAGKRVVAVVGAAHVPGITALFDTPVDRAALNRPPPPKWYAGCLKWLVPAILVATFFLGLQQTDGRGLAELVLAWVLPTSLASGIGALLTGGRPLSILAALVSSPITTIHPLIASGMIVGPVEAWARKPTVADAENIHRDVQSVRGFFRNPFTRTLIVAVGASLGSAIGAWIGLTWVVSLVA
jgi:pheromone shutdown-related protein TraB